MFDSWVGKIPWRRKWKPTPAVLSAEGRAQRSLVGYSPWGRRETQLSNRTKKSKKRKTEMGHLIRQVLFSEFNTIADMDYLVLKVPQNVT